MTVECERCDGQGEVFDRKDFWGNDLTVQCPECNGDGRAWSLPTVGSRWISSRMPNRRACDVVYVDIVTGFIRWSNGLAVEYDTEFRGSGMRGSGASLLSRWHDSHMPEPSDA